MLHAIKTCLLQAIRRQMFGFMM